MKLTDWLPESQKNLNKAIDDAIVDILAYEGVAIRVVGLEFFDRHMIFQNQRIKLKHPITYSRLVQVKTAEIKLEIFDIISAVKGDLSCAGFTTDIWTSSAIHPFIDKNWILHRCTGQFIGGGLTYVFER